jgi:heme/copper-type cytochrome/quinol oxidase subunit 1
MKNYLVHYYPDAFSEWNMISSFGSWISVVSLILFFFIVYKTLTSADKFENKKNLGWTYR